MPAITFYKHEPIPMEMHKVKIVQQLHLLPTAQRLEKMQQAGFNTFQLHNGDIFLDMLTDSGVNAMSDRQQAAMLQADDAYAGSETFFRMQAKLQELFGIENCLPAHQGRACENILATRFVKPGSCVIMNYHFTTAKAHITRLGGRVEELVKKEGLESRSDLPFKGDIDLDALAACIQRETPENIPFVRLEAGTNLIGGQPISYANMKAATAICHRHSLLTVLDASLLQDNLYFIKTREPGYADKTIKEIVLEMYADADAATMSCKKDAIVNMGGFIATRKEDWYEGAKSFCIPYEGYLTYGGLNGRDLNAVAVGLDENTEFDMLETRIHQVQYLAKKLDEYGIPYQRPVGGHGVFIDADKVLTHVPKEEFPAQTLTCELYLEAGIRGCEIGYMLADRDPVTHENRFGGLDLLRLAIPRRVYTDNHMDVIAAALKNVYDRREQVTRGVAIEWEAPLMRHFTVKLRRL